MLYAIQMKGNTSEKYGGILKLVSKNGTLLVTDDFLLETRRMFFDDSEKFEIELSYHEKLKEILFPESLSKIIFTEHGVNILTPPLLIKLIVIAEQMEVYKRNSYKEVIQSFFIDPIFFWEGFFLWNIWNDLSKTKFLVKTFKTEWYTEQVSLTEIDKFLFDYAEIFKVGGVLLFYLNTFLDFVSNYAEKENNEKIKRCLDLWDRRIRQNFARVGGISGVTLKSNSRKEFCISTYMLKLMPKESFSFKLSLFSEMLEITRTKNGLIFSSARSKKIKVEKDDTIVCEIKEKSLNIISSKNKTSFRIPWEEIL